MVKNGTPASPAMARASRVLPVPGRADQQRAFGDLAAEAGELLRVAQELDDLFQLFLGLVDAGNVIESDRPCFSVNSFARHLPKPMAPPRPPPCIRFMK